MARKIEVRGGTIAGFARRAGLASALAVLASTPAFAQNASLFVMSVTDTTIQVMLHAEGLPYSAGAVSPVYRVGANAVVVNPIVLSTNNNISANGSYVQVVTVPATASADRPMTATLTYAPGASGTITGTTALPARAYARTFADKNGGHRYYSRSSNSIAYALLPDVTLATRLKAEMTVNVIGRNNLRTSYDDAWALWFGGGESLVKWTSARPLAGTDHIEITFFLYNPTRALVNNARIAMYGDICIGDDDIGDYAPVDPLRDSKTHEMIGFTMSAHGHTLSVINNNARKYGSETTPNQWGMYEDLQSVEVWDSDIASAQPLRFVDSGGVVRVRNIVVPAGALRVYTMYLGVGGRGPFPGNGLVADTTAKIYNGQPQGIPQPRLVGAAVGIPVPIIVKYDGQTTRPIEVGTYAVTADIGDSPIYEGVAGRPLGNFTILPKEIAGVEGAVDTKVYDGTTLAVSAPVTLADSNGVVEGDRVTLVIDSCRFASPNVGEGIPVAAYVTLAGTSAPNYSVKSPLAFSGDIVPKVLTASSPAIKAKEYDGTDTAEAAAGALDGGIVPGDDVFLVLDGARFASSNAGKGIRVTAEVSLGGADAANYALARLFVLRGDIYPKSLEAVEVAVREKVYDGTAAAEVDGRLGEGVIDGDDVYLVIEDGEFETPNAGEGIPVAMRMSLGGASAPNYTLALPAGLTGNIIPKLLPPDAVMPIGQHLHTGLDVTPEVTVMDGPNLLEEGVDYEIAYINNVQVGDSAVVEATGIGNYSGEALGVFQIVQGRGARLFIGPNMARRRSEDIVNFYWQGHNFGSGTLRIYDKHGNFVKKLELHDVKIQNYEKRRVGDWDLKNNNGELVQRGTYLVKGALYTAEGKKEIIQLIGVR